MFNICKSFNYYKFTILLTILSSLCFHTQSRGIELYKQHIFGNDAQIKIIEKYKTNLFNKPNKRCLEIGTYQGDTAVYIVENFCNGEGSYLDCIDVWDSAPSVSYGKEEGGKLYYQIFLKNAEKYLKTNKIIPHKGFSSTILVKLLNEIQTGEREKYDFIYLDGSHMSRDVYLDAALAWEMLNVGGYLLFDDYGQANCDPKVKKYLTAMPAIDGFLESYNTLYELLHKDWQVHIKKIADRPS